MLWGNPNVKSGVEKVEGAVGEPDDVAAAICFLAVPEARFITGTTLVVDGGRLDILP
jgi:NAD(P)-dependent dehydrogenase (short-subunit alcohol dehydrogenase family)